MNMFVKRRVLDLKVKGNQIKPEFGANLVDKGLLSGGTLGPRVTFEGPEDPLY